MRILYYISDVLFTIIYHIVGYRKKVVLQNLAHIFPHKARRERIQIAKAFYKQLCDLLVEHIKALTITPAALGKRVTLQSIEKLDSCYQQGQSILLVSGHFGNWEWAAHALATHYTLWAGYQPLHNPAIERIMRKLRTRFQRKAMPLPSLIKTLLTSRTHAAIAILIDQAPYKNNYQTTFLGQPTYVATTAAKIAQKTNYPLWYIQITKSERGHYQVRPILLVETPRQRSVLEMVETYMQKLSEDILHTPELWLWSHRRWEKATMTNPISL